VRSHSHAPGRRHLPRPVIDAVRSGSAVAIAAALILLLVDLFKAP
jgi:hypothetical protein